MKTVKIAIIDCVGLNYDGTTLKKKGIGGSESAIISIARELVPLGFEVSIFNDCDSPDTKPGVYDGVTYRPMRALAERDYGFDVVISQRTVIPFTPIDRYDEVRQPPPRDFDPNWFKQLQKPSQLKIMWMEDTFIWGDALLEYLCTNGYLNEIFNLSDWHISYTTNTFSHGPRRQFEVLKQFVWHTRNGINRWIDWVDIKKKDPNLFVYNASITKGMVPLVTKIWPRLKQHLPDARLKIIGGYYRFNNEPVNEAQQNWINLQNSVAHDPSIEFTGVIPQPKIAEIMAEASYNLYPGAFPETSGISTLESINYNTPIIGTRFGAMEESGTESASYYIDFPIEPNGLYPWINTDDQINRYVDLVLRVVSDRYLHQQKQYACNAAKDISTWDTIALQWKQHFFNKLGIDLDPDEKSMANWVNYRVQKVFGRRYANDEDIVVPEPPAEVSALPMPVKKIAFIDIVGMAYDGDTLKRKGMGGSESAAILVSKELAKIGFEVTVYNACDEDDCRPGVYDGVIYKPLDKIKTDRIAYDVVITSRVVTPFITQNFYNYSQQTNRKIDYQYFSYIQQNAKLKVFWMHDTFCWGDDILEDLVWAGAIDEIWTLSDFHAMYVMNAAHPRLRMHEVLRSRVWTTRNGLVKYFDKVDLDKKNPDMFMFNANMSKGLDPLLNGVWPKVKKSIPKAKLYVIGGHYKLGAAFAHNDEESEFLKIAGPHQHDKSIVFTGIISQKEVADLCAKASFVLYPTAFPETYSISTLEALYANTPVITCRFGALEETASPAGYLIDYSATPNSLFPNTNANEQCEKLARLAIQAHKNKKEHRHRMESLDVIKDLAGWDAVALEWKQHIYAELGLYLSASESRRALYTKSKYRKIFNRRMSTTEEWVVPFYDNNENKIVVISPFYNAADYIERCIASVASQDYTNYEHWLIDDASTDDSYTIAENYINQLPDEIRDRFRLIRNEVNCGAVYNHMSIIRNLNLNDIIIMLDGDDSLVNRSDIFKYYNIIHIYHDFTYGSCWSMVDNIPLVSQPYPQEVIDNKDFKNYHFNWKLPYTHLRTMKAKLLIKEPDSKFQDADGNWFKAGGDNSTFYAALENCDKDKIYVVSDITMNYNDASPLNDYKVNRTEQDRAISIIFGDNKSIDKLSKKENPQLTLVKPEPKNTAINLTPANNNSMLPKKRILIAIPTNRNIEAETFKSIYDLIIPDGYDVTFQYFWGYQVDQVRNLIAHWTIHNGFDYLFAVDSDISFSPDTLAKMLSHNKDIVSGIYIQRIPGTHVIEIMRKNAWGGVTHVDWNDIKGQGLVPIDGCGFGCCLVKAEVFRAIPYPHFLYHSAIDHKNTLSEDVHFCNQVRDRGFKLWADTSIICDHHGSWTYKVDTSNILNNITPSVDPIKQRLKELGDMPLLPQAHFDYLVKMRNEFNINPKIIYDIGACVLHWTNPAKMVWPNSQFFAFEAMDEVEFLYKEQNIPYHLGLLSDRNEKELLFYQNLEHPGGNSYYEENTEFSPAAEFLFNENHRVIKKTITLDTVVNLKGFPLPDLIKMDVQGAELDILKGASNTLAKCTDLILEVQNAEYNKGAPLEKDIIDYLKSLNFELVTSYFSGYSVQGDYHFRRKI